jgi:hypothetical protein
LEYLLWVIFSMLKTHWFQSFAFGLSNFLVYYHLQHQMLLRYRLRSYKILLGMPRGIVYNKDMLVGIQRMLYS